MIIFEWLGRALLGLIGSFFRALFGAVVFGTVAFLIGAIVFNSEMPWLGYAQIAFWIFFVLNILGGLYGVGAAEY